MRDDDGMSEQWIIRVEGKEYGPAELATLREWKTEGRVLATNEARRVDVDLWSTAAKIPGLFEVAPPPPVQVESSHAAVDDGGDRAAEPAAPRPQAKILAQTFRIYRQGFFQFLGLTLLVIGPSICAQLTGALVEATPNVDVDLRKLVEGAFAFCMLLLSIMLWPVYIAGIQIVTAQRAAGQRSGFLSILNEAVKYWPRVAFLCLFVYVCFAFWTILPLGIILALAFSAPSWPSIFLALLATTFQVWITGRLFVNFLFWQQFAVLDGCDVAESLRRSKELARSGKELPWFRRPMWRGVFIASLWCAFVFAIHWSLIETYFRIAATTSDPQTLVEALQNSAKSATTLSLSLGLLQSVLRPLLGIAFVLLYFDSKIDN
jgi:hypothetical protein